MRPPISSSTVFAAVAALLAVTPSARSQAAPDDAVRPASITEQCRSVLPDDAAMQWADLPWRTTFGAAALEADAADRPILLWTMNGHPLGLT